MVSATPFLRSLISACMRAKMPACSTLAPKTIFEVVDTSLHGSCASYTVLGGTGGTCTLKQAGPCLQTEPQSASITQIFEFQIQFFTNDARRRGRRRGPSSQRADAVREHRPRHQPAQEPSAAVPLLSCPDRAVHVAAVQQLPLPRLPQKPLPHLLCARALPVPLH